MNQNENLPVKQETPPQEGTERTRETSVYRPAVDIRDAQDHIVLHVDMPGVDEHHVDISLEKNILTIRGQVDPPQYAGFQLAYAEYGVGDFERSFSLSDEIDRDGIAATVKDGVLTVQLPKVKQATQRRIAVTAG